MLPDDVNQFFIDIAKEAMKIRIESKINQEDFLSYMIMLKEKKGLSDLDIAAHCATLFIDGYETTSVNLHHTLHELGKNKRVQDELRKQINENTNGMKALSYEQLLDFPYLDQVIYESLRLNPPVLFTTRVCSEDFEYAHFNGKKLIIRKNSSIWIPIFSIHRDPEFYSSPGSFLPERFDPEFGGIKSFKDRCVLIPFGGGPRTCLGMKFADIQIKAAIVEVVRNFEISIDKQTPEIFKVGPTEFMNVSDDKIMLNFKPIN